MPFQTSPSARPTLATLPAIRALIVDDNEHMRSIVASMLRGFGIRDIRHAANGEEALRATDANHPQVVICDWMMEPMNGFEFIKRTRAAGNNVPIIMLTGNAQREDILAAREAGVTDYMVKPIAPPQLHAKLAAIIANHKLAATPTRETTPVDSAPVDSAQGDLAKLGDNYLGILESDIAALEGRLSQLEGAAFDEPPTWHQLYRKAHDLKGQAGTFDFWLVTSVADRLCQLLRVIEEAFELRLRDRNALFTVLRSHINALKLIAKHRIMGDGGPNGQRMLSTLDQNMTKLRRLIGLADENPQEQK